MIAEMWKWSEDRKGEFGDTGKRTKDTAGHIPGSYGEGQEDRLVGKVDPVTKRKAYHKVPSGFLRDVQPAVTITYDQLLADVISSIALTSFFQSYSCKFMI